MGVIDSLSAGYRFLGRRVELLIIPILLDLLFWLGPRLSVAPLLQQVIDFYNQASSAQGLPSDMVEQTSTLLSEVGQQSNLLNVLASSSLHVPSLMADTPPLATSVVISISSPLAAILLFAGFFLLGALIGVIYMNMLARALPIGDGPKAATFGQFVSVVMHQWVMVMIYVALVLAALLIASIPVTLVVAVVTLVSPVLASLVITMLAGIILVCSFYLYFVTPGIILDNLPVHRAIAQSFLLVRNNFWSTLGFIILCNVILIGFSFLMGRVAAIPPVGTIIAIVVYSYIGTGTTMALLVFYRTRLLKQDERLVSVVKP